MNGTLVQKRIWHGYAKAALKVGALYQFYRPNPKFQLEDGGDLLLEDQTPMLVEGGFPGAAMFSRYVSLNAEDMKYGRPNKYGKSTWYALMDGAGLKPGDYFIGQSPEDGLQLEDNTQLTLEDQTDLLLEGVFGDTYFFIAAMQLLLPILVVECNRTISIARPQPQTGKGAQDYSGMTAANEIPFVTGVPCSILQGTKGEKNETALPSDTRSPWWTILLPAAVGRIKYGDLIIDDLGQRYIVSSPERTDLGWRLNCAMAMA